MGTKEGFSERVGLPVLYVFNLILNSSVAFGSGLNKSQRGLASSALSVRGDQASIIHARGLVHFQFTGFSLFLLEIGCVE